MTSESTAGALQRRVWSGTIPLEIRLANAECRVYDQSDTYLVNSPRLSYLPLLLPRLHAFFQPVLIDPESQPRTGWFSVQDVPLHWHYPIGLLYDLYSGAKPHTSNVRRTRGSRPSEDWDRGDIVGQLAGRERPTSRQSGLSLGREDDSLAGGAREISLRDLDDAAIDAGGDEQSDAEKLPWKLVVHFNDYPADALIQLDTNGKVLEDAFINSVKEAGFVRNGTGKVVMSLGANDSRQLWKSVEQHDLPLFNSINSKLLNAPGTPVRNIPFRVFLPTTSGTGATPSSPPPLGGSPTVASPVPDAVPAQTTASNLRMIQRLVPPTLTPSTRQVQTLGTALHALLPTLFPSRRQPVLAWPVIHGAVVPMAAPLEELGKWASYADGWVTVGVVMME